VDLTLSQKREAEVVPGALLSQLSALADPQTFVWPRLGHAWRSAADPRTADLQMRIERWALDEMALSGRLLREVMEWLYREDRFCAGILPIGDRLLGPQDLRLPCCAVVNTADAIAPAASLDPVLAALPHGDVQRLELPGESSVALQHLAVLVGSRARAQTWPAILAWLGAHA
jgi:polyhydroxyalkanoate synthase